MVKVNEICPQFATKTDSGEDFNSREFSTDFMVIYFYPKDSTPGCTIEACNFNNELETFTKLGAKVVGISKDSLVSHLNFKQKQNLQFDLLLDENAEICKMFGVLKEKSMFGKKYFGIERSTFITDNKGKIIKIWNKVKVNGHVKEVISFLENHVE